MSIARGRSAVSLGAAHLPAGKQVRVSEQLDRAQRRPLSAGPWTVAWAGLALAVPISLWVLVPGSQPPNVPVLIAVFLGLLAAESFSVQFEFRKQSFSWSPSELAFVMALVAVGGAWTAVARAVAVGIAVAVQGYPRPKVAFNVCRRRARGVRGRRRPAAAAARATSPSRPPGWSTSWPCSWAAPWGPP